MVRQLPLVCPHQSPGCQRGDGLTLLWDSEVEKEEHGLGDTGTGVGPLRFNR